MDFTQYIQPELLVLVPVLYVIGTGLNKSVMDNNYIPIMLGLISITLCAIWVLANADLRTDKEIATAVFTAITQGVLIAGASVYTDQIIKQIKREE